MRGYDVGVFDDGSAPLVSPCEDLGLSGYWFIRSASVSSLSVGARSDGDVQLASANFSLSQTFTFSYDNGYYHIIYAETGLALETAPGIASSPSDVSLGAVVSQSKRQQWSAVRTESGALRFLGNDMIIDAYGPVDVHSMWSRGVPRGVLRFYQ